MLPMLRVSFTSFWCTHESILITLVSSMIWKLCFAITLVTSLILQHMLEPLEPWDSAFLCGLLIFGISLSAQWAFVSLREPIRRRARVLLGLPQLRL